MKQLILSGMFVVCGLSVSLASEKWAVDSINWHRAEQKMQEKDFQDAALTYKELITKGDSLFVDYAGRHVEDMREQYSIDELDLQNGMQQKKNMEIGVYHHSMSGRFVIRRTSLFVGERREKLLFSREELQKAKKAGRRVCP